MYYLKKEVMNLNIDTHSQETMIHSILKYFNISLKELNDLFFEASEKSNKDSFVDNDKLNQVFDTFIEAHLPEQEIDQILFFHLSRRLNSTYNNFNGNNLFELLTTENPLSLFLKKHEVVFEFNSGHLELYYKDTLMPLENTYESYVPYLRSRLGYNKGREDYCFNGFAFKDLLYRNSYARELYDVPEFVGHLSTFLKCRDIGTEYFNCSKYYCIEYCVPIKKVLFDKNDKFTDIQKKLYFLNQVLHRLYDYFFTNNRYMFDHDNPILRLMDNDTMQSTYFVKSEEVTWEMLG